MQNFTMKTVSKIKFTLNDILIITKHHINLNSLCNFLFNRDYIFTFRINNNVFGNFFSIFEDMTPDCRS